MAKKKPMFRRPAGFSVSNYSSIAHDAIVPEKDKPKKKATKKPAAKPKKVTKPKAVKKPAKKAKK